MNIETKRQYDSSYDWWSAEGDHKLIKLTNVSEFAIEMVNKWHEYFFWKPVTMKLVHLPFVGEGEASRAKFWKEYDFHELVFLSPSAPCSDWSKGYDLYSHEPLTDINRDGITRYTILYERAINKPYLKELGEVQDECEELVKCIPELKMNLMSVELKLGGVLPFGKAKAREMKATIERDILQKQEQLESCLARAKEIRGRILSE